MQNEKWNYSWITGFIDAESSFMVSIGKRSTYKLGWSVEPRFSICLHAKDLPLLYRIQSFFGVGTIKTASTRQVAYFSVSKLNDLVNVIIPYFINNPLLTKKKADFLLFKSVVELVSQGEHLTSKGLIKIVSIRASLSRGLSAVLTEGFPNILPGPRPLVGLTEIPDPNWLTGFVEGEGSFMVLLSSTSYPKRFSGFADAE